MRKYILVTLFVFTALINQGFSQSLGNNTCATAVSLPLTGVCVSGNNNTATSSGDPSASCFSVENGVFFKIVAPASGVVTVTTNDGGTNFDS